MNTCHKCNGEKGHEVGELGFFRCRHCKGSGEEPRITLHTFLKSDNGFELSFASLSTGMLRVDTPDGHRFDDVPRWIVVALINQLQSHLERLTDD
jgi:hypothetical protein